MKQNNFYRLLRRTDPRRTLPGALAPTAAVCCLCLAAWGGLTAHTACLERRLAEMPDVGDAVSVPAAASAVLGGDELRAEIRYAGQAAALAATYPLLDADLLAGAEGAGGEGALSFTGYDAATGVMTLAADAPTPDGIAALARALEGIGLFLEVDYGGYSPAGDRYAADLRCTLPPPDAEDAS